MGWKPPLVHIREAVSAFVTHSLASLTDWAATLSLPCRLSFALDNLGLGTSGSGMGVGGRIDPFEGQFWGLLYIPRLFHRMARSPFLTGSYLIGLSAS